MNNENSQPDHAENSEKTGKADIIAPYQFKPGKSGNPGGRPKKKPITDLYESILNDPEQMAVLRASIIRVLARGNMAMVLQLREMTDRIEGKVTLPIEADLTMNLAEVIAAARKRVGERASK